MAHIENRESTALVKDCYFDYAKYSLTSRSIPSIIDGFKAGQRRLLYCAAKFPNGKLVKSSKIIGDTLPYHPHSNDSLYGTLVGLATPTNSFKQFEGNGNWGGPKDPAAAIRYTEAMLNETARFCYTQFVDYADYEVGEADISEPTALPALVPYSSIKGSNGIAVGLSTNIMPLNIMEVIDYCIAKLRGKSHPMPTPDFGDFIIDMDDRDIRKAVSDYSGRVKIKSRINQEGNRLVINDLFVARGKGHKSIDAILKNLSDLIDSGKIDFRDETTTHTRYVFEVMDSSVDIGWLRDKLSRMSSGYQSFNRVVVENGKGIFCSFDYQIDATLNYLRKVIERKISSEMDKFKKDESVLLVIQHIKTSGLLKELPKLSSDEVRKRLRKQGFSDDVISVALGKSITYLTKSHDKELKDIQAKIKSHSEIDVTDYMISLYKDFKTIIRPIYNEYPHSIRRSKLLSNPHIRKIDSTHIEISDGKKGYKCSGLAYLVYPDGSIEPYNVSIDSAATIPLEEEISDVVSGDYIVSVTSDDGIIVTESSRIDSRKDIVKLNGDTVVRAGSAYNDGESIIFEDNGKRFDVSSCLRMKYSLPIKKWRKYEIV